MTSSSGVLQIHSTDLFTMRIHIHLKNLDNQQETDLEKDLPSSPALEIGWTDGWDFQPNEEISIWNENYTAAKWITSKMENGEVGIKEETSRW